MTSGFVKNLRVLGRRVGRSSSAELDGSEPAVMLASSLGFTAPGVSYKTTTAAVHLSIDEVLGL